jgi:hypothetical protein
MVATALVMACSAVIAVVLLVLRGLLISTVLPGLIRSQVATALGREVSVAKVETSSFPRAYIRYTDIKVSLGPTFASGILIHSHQLFLRFSFWPIVWNAFRPAGTLRAIRRAELIEPVVDLDVATVRSAIPTARRCIDSAWPFPLPRCYFGFKDGTIELHKGSRLILEVVKVRAEVDLRDWPRIDACLRFTMPPDADVSAEASCHLAIRTFKGSLAVDELDLARCTSACRALGAPVVEGLAGRLTGQFDIEGGFKDEEEFREETSARVIYEVAGGRAPDVMAIILRELRKAKPAKVEIIPPAKSGKPVRVVAKWGPQR